MIVPVILSGGAGTRLWPLSRELYPKQLLPLVGDHTMLQETALRLEGVSNRAAPLVVCNEAHRFMVAEQLRQAGQQASTIILEPVGRNTAPAMAVAALQAMTEGDDPLLLVLPADHVIERPEALRQAISIGAPAAEEGRLLTFGIVPTAPETGYGYIKAGPLSVVRGPLHGGRDDAVPDSNKNSAPHEKKPENSNHPPTVDRSSTTDHGQRTTDRFNNGQIYAQVHTLSGYSAHADRRDLVNFVCRMRHKPQKVRLVHGEAEAKAALARELEALGVEVD